MTLLIIYLLSAIAQMALGKYSKEPSMFWGAFLPIINTVFVTLMIIVYVIQFIASDKSPINTWIKK